MTKDMRAIMAQNFKESVPNTMKTIVIGNEPFKITEHGKTYYVGMLLNTEKIGGITKKSQNDKNIGGMIEAVNGGKIDLYVTSESNERGELLFIPTSSTMYYLNESPTFRMCKEYEFVKMNARLDIVERTGIFASYDTFRAIAAGEVSITDYIKPDDESVGPNDPGEISDEIPQDEGEIVPVIAEQRVEGELPFDDKETEFVEKTSVIDKAKAVVEKVGKAAQTVAEKIADNTGYSDMVDKKPDADVVRSSTTEQTQTTDDGSDTQEEKSIIYTEIQVESSIERTFYANDLELSVSSEPFDQLFTLDNQLIKFDFDDRDTYVNSHLNVMAVNANRDLKKLRADNLRKLREKYFMLMSLCVTDIQRELDIHNQSTIFGGKKWALDETKRDRLEKIGTAIDERRKLIEDKYNQSRDDYCNAAAQKAKTDYNTMHQRSHNDEMNKVEGIVKHEIEADYERELQELYLKRKDEALTLLDMNITNTLTELMKDRQEMFEAEKALYNKCADEMRKYAADLHAEDAKRLAIEEERNRISNEITSARADATAKIDLIKREYETAQTALEAKSQVIIAQAENQAQMLKDQMNERTAVFEKDREHLQQQLDDAIKNATTMQEVVKTEYEHRLLQAQDDRDSWKQTLETYKEQHKHNNRLAIVVVIAVVFAALIAGFMVGGLYWNKLMGTESLENSRIASESDDVLRPSVSTSYNDASISSIVDIY